MSALTLQVENLSKRYTLGDEATYRRLSDSIASVALAPLRILKRNILGAGATDTSATGSPGKPVNATSFWALKEVTFDVHEGEVLGIIGRNGAGKSTLLKILSRITEPTEGEIRVRGRVGSLLEVGTGFHPELTGHENIYLNGAVLGMTTAEVRSKYDAIVEFSEVEKFLYTPVKHYSSGMYMRLAFAVAAHLDPEILIVDEVLAVGDAAFQRKCLGKMTEVARGGRTVIFVSHNMAAVQNLCTSGLLLDEGRIVLRGAPADVTRAYMSRLESPTRNFNAKGRRASPRNVQIVDAWIEHKGHRTTSLLYGDDAEIIIDVEVFEQTKFSVELLLRQQDRLPVAFAPSGLAFGWEIEPGAGRARVRCRIPPVQLAAGGYSVDLILALTNQGFLDYVESGIEFSIDSAALGDRNWAFTQARGQGHSLWPVTFEVDRT